MLKSIADAKSLPGWAILIMIAILSFLVTNTYNDLKAQDEAQWKLIGATKEKNAEIEKGLSLVQQCLDIEMRYIKEQMGSLKTQQTQIYYMIKKMNGNHPGMEQ